jgi:hypothetical protein
MQWDDELWALVEKVRERLGGEFTCDGDGPRGVDAEVRRLALRTGCRRSQDRACVNRHRGSGTARQKHSTLGVRGILRP